MSRRRSKAPSVPRQVTEIMSKARNGNITRLPTVKRASAPSARPHGIDHPLGGGLGLLFEIAAMFAVLGATLTLTLLPIL